MLTEKNYKKLLKLFLSILPIFSLKVIYNNLFTFIQIIIIGLFFIWKCKIDKECRSKLKYIFIYFLFLIIYGIFHHINALNFHSLVPGNFHYNYVDEFLYLIKMSMPVLFVYLIIFSKLNKEDYLKIIKSWIIIICGTIIVTNIFQISLSSYNDEVIKGNIFNWFSNNYIYNELASKGFFMYANQISCILVVLNPISLYYYFKQKLNFLYLVAILLACLMLGTRVSNLGSILVFIFLVLANVFQCLIIKKKIQWKKLNYCGILILIYCAILPFSPTFSRYEIYDYLMPKNISGLIASTSNSYTSKIEYIKNHYEEKLINENFILNSYSYEYDPDFWLEILNKPINKRADYRYLEISMIKRVVEINNNKWDVLLGITNDRIQNIFNIERDYILQYYAYGIIGCLLFLGIYLLLLFKNLIALIKSFNYFNICILATTILFLFIAYLSGNILGQISCFIPCLLLISMSIKVEKKKNL